MPGGQFTNLKEQARSLGISISKWGLVAKTYAEVNKMFGDIIKVTPSSKVVGDMALYMIANDLRVNDIINSKKEINFPQSVIEFFKGELGTPYGGFPKALQKKILGSQKPLKERPGKILKSIDLINEKNTLEKTINQTISNQDLASYIMYPNVFIDFIKFQNKYSDTSILPTPLFFYGPNIDQEYSLTIESGKNLIIRYLAKGETNINGLCSVFFELNGQPRTIEVEDRSYSNKKNIKILADINNPNHLGSPLPGQVSQIFIKDEDKIIKGDKVLIIEAMKMETIITAHKSGTIKSLQVKVGSNLDAKDLLLEID